jgi:hypothetical protein
MLASYPQTRLLVNNGAKGVITFAGGASDNILVPGKSIASNSGPLVASSDLTDSATACPGFAHEVYRVAPGQKTALMLTPVILGTANDSGSNDASGKSAVVSIVACHDISSIPPAAVDSNQKASQFMRHLLAQVRFTGETTTTAVVSSTIVEKLCDAAQFATYTGVNARSVFCTRSNSLGGTLLPSGLFDYGHSYGFDIGTADYIEIYVSCVGDITGTPGRSAPAFGAFVNWLIL